MTLRIPGFILRPLAAYLIKRAKRTPYFPIHGTDRGAVYMERYWLFGGSARDERGSGCPEWQKFMTLHTAAEIKSFGDYEDQRVMGWTRSRFDRWLGRYVAARVHVTMRSDADRHKHTHPWWNMSVVLAGIIHEDLPRKQSQHFARDVEPDGSYRRKLTPGCVVLRSPNFRHKQILLNGPTVTLFIMGPWRQRWGFAIEDGTIKHWKVYLSEKGIGQEEYLKNSVDDEGGARYARR